MDEVKVVKVVPPKWALVLNTFLSVLISCAVFAIVAKLIVIPQIARQELEIRAMAAQSSALSAQVVALQAQVDGLLVKPEAAPSPAPTAAPGATPAPGAPAAGAEAAPAKAP